VIELQTDADRALAAGAHEGVLKGSGRMIVGSVSSEVYRRIEEHVRKAAGAPDPSQPENAAVTTKSPSEQNTNVGAAGAITAGPSRATPAAPATDKQDSATARETLRAGARILAAYWNEKREFEGFRLATVTIHVRDVIAKKRGGRRIPMHPDLRRALEKLALTVEPVGPVIRSYRGSHLKANSVVNWFVALFKELGYEGCSSHSGRRSFITMAARNVHRSGCSLRDVQLLAGHRSIETTERYIDGDTCAQRRLVAYV
jgi:hypothetical protein